MIQYVGIVAGVVDAVLYFQEGNYMEGLLCIAGACIGAGGAMAAVGAAKGVCAVTTAGMALKTAGTAFTATVMMQYTIEGAEKTLDIMAANGGKMNREAWMSAAQTAMCGMGAVAGFMAVGSCIDEMASLSARGLACFVAGTKVLTDEGLKNIEDIQAGDYVYSTDEETGESGYKEVVNTFAKDTEVLTHVAYELEDESYSYSQSEHKESYIDKENIHCNDRGEDGYNNRGNSEQQESTTKYSSEIITTMNHRFWCEGEWKSAGTLEEGDILTLADGSEAIVTEVTFEETHTTVYNMEVADYHTYYVGEDSVWVHNMGEGGCGITAVSSGSKERGHTASWEHLDSKGNVVSSGTETSGGSELGRRLTWTEQLDTHTESKIIKGLEGNVKSGDTIVITGTKPPCNPGRSSRPTRGCQGLMQRFAEENNINILYFQRGDVEPWIFPR